MDSTTPWKPAPAAEDYNKTLDDIYKLLLKRETKHEEKKSEDEKNKEREIEEKKIEEKRNHIIEIHQKALDDLVNVNSLFTIAVFVGLSLATPGQHSLEQGPGCDADPGVKMRLVVYEVVSFGCFLLSSLVAKTLKVFLNIYQKTEFKDLRLRIGRGFMLSLSALSSVIGIIFLALSMAHVIQIRIGKLSCGSGYSYRAVGSLCALVLLALFIYVPAMIHAIWISVKHKGC